MIAAPAVIPDTTPVEAFTEATAGLEELHTPPGTAFVNVVLAPVQTDEAPDMADGVALTVTSFVTMHPPTE